MLLEAQTNAKLLRSDLGATNRRSAKPGPSTKHNAAALASPRRSTQPADVASDIASTLATKWEPAGATAPSTRSASARNAKARGAALRPGIRRNLVPLDELLVRLGTNPPPLMRTQGLRRPTFRSSEPRSGGAVDRHHRWSTSAESTVPVSSALPS
jgi:hypothetical protein